MQNHAEASRTFLFSVVCKIPRTAAYGAASKRNTAACAVTHKVQYIHRCAHSASMAESTVSYNSMLRHLELTMQMHAVQLHTQMQTAQLHTVHLHAQPHAAACSAASGSTITPNTAVHAGNVRVIPRRLNDSLIQPHAQIHAASAPAYSAAGSAAAGLVPRRGMHSRMLSTCTPHTPCMCRSIQYMQQSVHRMEGECR